LGIEDINTKKHTIETNGISNNKTWVIRKIYWHVDKM